MKKLQVGDSVVITGHTSFPGGDLLPIGHKLVVKEVAPMSYIQNSIIYQFGKHPSMNWCIHPDDFEILNKEWTYVKGNSETP